MSARVYASFGSISSGTMRTEDLLNAFASELEYHVRCNAAHWCSDTGRSERDRLVALYSEAQEVEDYDSEEAAELVGTLWEELSGFAPPYAYFGAHPDDGADYGYWLPDDIENCFDGLKVDDTSEVPADYSGEVLHVNDHGNMTLYTADKGELTEIWGI